MYQGEKSQSIITDRMSNKEDLPSINDYLEDSNLPSYKDFIEEKHQLPSVEDYISESPKEEVLVEEQENIDPVLSETAPEWAELVRLVNDVRKNIPEIPEIKYYDTELCEISEKILQIEQDYVKSDKIDVLSVQNEEFEGKLSEIESKIPTVKYYDHDINTIYDKITDIKEEINNLPEVKYYEEDLKSLKSRIEQVNQDIPTFPDWIQEVQEVPDFSWIGKTFSLIDDDFNKVQGHIDLIKGKIDREVSAINESIEVKEFEFKVDVKNLNENLDLTNDRITQTKDKIYQEIKETSIRIWELRNTFKDDDKKLKKSILSEQNKLKQSLEKQIEKIDEQSVKADESILKFFNELKETVDTLPEVKYYDEDISSIKGDISSLKSGLKELNELSSLIKKDQKILKENYLLNEPPSVKEKAGGQTDPLTPLDQKFATLDDLSNHYRLFINRITTQLSTMGGGGAGFIKDLDDVSFDQTTGTNKLLIYDGSKWVGIASTALGGGGSVGAGGTWAVGSAGIHTTKNVGIGATARTDFTLHVGGDGQFTGNLSVGGTITYDDVKHVDSIGLSTFRSGIEVNTGTATTALLVRGDARITGILAIGTASVTIDGDNNTITTGIVTITNSQVTIGNNVVIDAGATGNVSISGIVTAKTGSAVTYYGDGSNLTGLTGASAATYGDASNVAQIVVDADGRITGISEVTISGGGGSSGIEIENNGTSVGTGITAINFSTNVTVTASGGIATVTASGGGGGSSSFAIIDEVESFSTGGGSFISGAWQDRDLNTVTYDDDDIIDLNSSTGEVTLKAAGTYKIDFRAPGFRCDYHVTRILDTSITLVRGRGSSTYSQDSGFYAQTDSVGSTIYTTTDVNQKFKLQHRCTSTQSSAVGMGGPHNVSAIGNNYYSQVIVTKLS